MTTKDGRGTEEDGLGSKLVLVPSKAGEVMEFKLLTVGGLPKFVAGQRSM
jgi:hypothetical protein